MRYCILCGRLTGEDNVCRNPDCSCNRKTVSPSYRGESSFRRPVRLADRVKQRNEQAGKWGQYCVTDFEQEENVPLPGVSQPHPEPPVEEEELSAAPHLISDRWKVYGKGRTGEGYRGFLTILLSVLASAMGTLIFGAMYLEDFLWRWVVTGVITPVFAYGLSFLYGWLMVRNSREPGATCNFLSEWASVVVGAARIPNVLLVLTCFLSPLDKNLGVFQFFALLLVIAWVVCLYTSVLTRYRGIFSTLALILTVLFAFLALTSMRALWVWFLTGDFRFTLYIPLNIFF